MIFPPPIEGARRCGVIAALYDAQDSVESFMALDLSGLGFRVVDVILADELGFKDVTVGVVVACTEEGSFHEICRGTRVVAQGPDEWLVDARFWLSFPNFMPAGQVTEAGFTGTEATFHYLQPGRWAIQSVAGHSLAGAWAKLRRVRLGVPAFSLAAPRVGTQAWIDWSRKTAAPLYSWAVAADLVPKVPLHIEPLFDYQQDMDVVLDSAGIFRPAMGLKDTLLANHSIRTYWHLLDNRAAIDPAFALAA